ncbi:chitinase [Andreprevotia lacus DSM 23236]|jgi:chitinase|uniref:chitinase n=1 Tax=Andreprevotia lacus DSM 23236 TaxID=1121001 RepID=A0A1W1WX40_9NEIS|nr:glycosyl hydrolase family 18 protein [Andreprevotia lacus]SMC16292.1 chitinase [Andreprevotia lacus DSM 23236]
MMNARIWIALSALALAACGGGDGAKLQATAAGSAAGTTSASSTAAGAAPALAVAESDEERGYNNREAGSYFNYYTPLTTGYSPQTIDGSGAASKLTFINYAFAITQSNSDGSHGCQLPWAYIDYGKPTSAAYSVDGQADQPGQKLMGNLQQFRKLKQKYPHLKLFLSVGGGGNGGYWFSAAAATPASRKAFVANCVKLLKGDLPTTTETDNYGEAGGPGAAAGVFDGIDIDWEYPGIAAGGRPYDAVNDKHNFTLLMREFRRQLNELSGYTGKDHYYLTYAGSVIFDKFAQTEALEVSHTVDWVNLMGYDFTAADWLPNGPTNFHANLYVDPASPTIAYNGVQARFDSDSGVKRYLAAGVSPRKLVLGVSYQGYGWGNVAAGNNHGLYQPAQGGANHIFGLDNMVWAIPYFLIEQLPGTVYHDPVTKSVWKYDEAGQNFIAFEDPETIATKVQYARDLKLRGLFSWALDLDDYQTSLTTAMAKVRDKR